jgi:competence protein ComEC
VGSNDFGHPVPWVIDTLEDAGALVYRTDRDGDIVVAFDSGGPVVSPSHPGGE